MTTHLMLDDVDDVILFGHANPAYAIAGYMNGRWANWASIVKMFPTGKFLLSIAVSADVSVGAQTLDIENGDATIAQAPAWFKGTQAAGKAAKDFRWYPKLYTSISNGHDLLSTMEKAGVKRSEYMLWSAHYTGKPHICGPKSCGAAVQADATQWTDKYDGVSLDASMCYGNFFSGPADKPVPQPKPRPKRHVADGTVSLDKALATMHLGLVPTIETSVKKLSDRNARRLLAYMATGPAVAMPKGLVFWTAR